MIEHLELNGIWFLPAKPEEQLTGTLTFSPSEGADLRLIGSFSSDDLDNLDKSFDIILGVTLNGKPITLYKCFKYTHTKRIPGIESCNYSSQYILVGSHFIKGSDLQFDVLRAKFKNLDEWLRIYGFKTVSIEKNNKGAKLEFTLPDTIKFKFGDENAEFKFDFSAPFSTHIFKGVIEQDCHICLTTAVPIPFYEKLKALESFQNFFTLATYEVAFPIHISVMNSEKYDSVRDKKYPIEITIYYKGSNNTSEGRKKKV